jgi:cell division septal protein FtsQ
MAEVRTKQSQLRERRRAARRRWLIALSVIILLLIAAIFYCLQQPYVRISHIAVSDGDAGIEAIAEQSLAGSYYHLVPRDSYFFVSEAAIRSVILAAHPELESVSISRAGLTGLSIVVHGRVPLARWCGSTLSTSSGQAATSTDSGTCYLFDATGFIYQAAASSSAPLSDLLVYAPTSAAASTSPVGATVASADKLPAVFEFARDIAKLGADVASVVLRGDEVDLYLPSGTRVTYVLGDEQGAYTLAVSAFPQLNLKDGSILYVDLRFSSSGRVYFKRSTSK